MFPRSTTNLNKCYYTGRRIVKTLKVVDNISEPAPVPVSTIANVEEISPNNGDSHPAKGIFNIVNAPFPMVPMKDYYKRSEIETRILDAIIDTAHNPEGGALIITGHSGVGVTTTVAHLLQENEIKEQHKTTSQSESDEEILVFWLNCSRYRDDQVDGNDEKMIQLICEGLVQVTKSLHPEFDYYPSRITSYFKEKKPNRQILFMFDDMINFKLNQNNSTSTLMSCCVVVTELYQLRTLDTTKRVEVVGEISNSEVKNLLEIVYEMNDHLTDGKLIKLAERCCGLPLIASLISAGLKLGPETWDFDTFMRNSNAISEEKLEGRQFRTVQGLFQASINQLHHEWRKCYYSFLVFSPGEHVSIRDLEPFWSKYSILNPNQIIEFLQARSLVGKSPDSSQLAIHPLLYRAALELASKEFNIPNSDNRLDRLRLWLVTSAAEGEMILFPIVRHQRLNLLRRILAKIDTENLAQLCKQLSDTDQPGTGETFLQFLYRWANENDSFSNHLYDVIRDILLKLLKSLPVKEVLKVVNAPSEDGSSSFLIDVLDDGEMLEQSSNERQAVALLLNRWKLVYFNECWRRTILADNKTKNTLLITVMKAKRDQDPRRAIFAAFNKATVEEVREAFVAAARCNRLNMIEQIYQEACTKEAENDLLDDSTFETALMFASAAGYLDLVRYLCEKSRRGASMLDSDNRTPFFVASENCQLDVAQFLYELDKKAIAIPDIDGRTPFWAAAYNGNLDVLTFLCEKYPEGASIPNKKGETPTWIAAGNANFDIVKYLYENDNKCVSMVANDGTTPLWNAAARGNLEIVKFLAEKDSNTISLKNEDGATPLWAAAANGHLQVVKFLCEKDQSCILQQNDEGEYEGTTPLWIAAAMGHLDIVKFLYEKNNHSAVMPEKNGVDPLTIAITNGQVEVAEFLINHLQQREETHNAAE